LDGTYAVPRLVGANPVDLFKLLAPQPLATPNPTTPPGSGIAEEEAQSEPLDVLISQSGKVLILFTARVALEEWDAKVDETEARFRYWLLVDSQPIRPTLPPIEVAPGAGGMTIHAQARVVLPPGVHRVQVMAQSVPGAIYSVRHQALDVITPLQ
jgi:hypothetical protein